MSADRLMVLDEYIRASEIDSNLWWHLSSGHQMNLLEEAIGEIERLRIRIAELETPTWYWDDRCLDSAIHPEDVCDYDDVDDIVPYRPIHELPIRWALVTDDGVKWYDTEEAARAVGGER